MAYVAGAVMCIIFGAAYIAMKIALETINPLTIIASRYLLAALVLHAIYFLKKSKEKIKREDLKYLIFIGMLEPVLFFIFDAYGLTFTTAIRASIILSVIPVLTAFLASPILKEKLTPLKLITTIGSAAGVMLVISSKEPASSGSNYLLGDALILLACISAAFYTVLARKLSFKYSFFTITRFQSLMAVICFLPLGIGETALNGFAEPSLRSLLSILFLGVLSSALAYLLLNYTIAKLSAANSSIFANMVPLATIILSKLFLNEYLGITKIIGLLVVISFVFALSWGERK